MKRYKNPDIFEPLAMAYALGTLHGKARLRFEQLMARHLYLRATVQAYQQKLNGLAEILPPQAVHARVWQGIEQHLNLKVAQPSFWSRLQNQLNWALPSLAAIIAAVLTAFFLHQPPKPQAYVAALKSTQQHPQLVLAMAKHDEMKISFDLLDQNITNPQGMIPTLWCISKKKDEPPMRMGTLEPTKPEISINAKMWQGLEGASQFAISLEPNTVSASTQPQGEIILSGTLHPLGQ
ncbi:anti-sigma factor [Thiothrix eikelboomii]|uniref:Anti-sigma-K factor RskA n=1 Tax=Thiothrix eikelboomii TaxID=92487 RepID=A0A1T4VTQ5_9GAMM|nr:anti-sigma factor [Thiothrix eikelboomii]SKA68380.1 Anti-sigma-K factor RskA [Thiothrix eikelboomii]